MKTLYALLLIVVGFTANAQLGYRYTTIPGSNNQYAITKKAIVPVSYASTISLVPDAEETTYNVAALSGAVTVNLSKTKAYTGDRVWLILKATGSTRTVTWGNYITGNASTLSVTTSATKVVEFVFDGSTWVALLTGSTGPTGATGPTGP